jgi:hypothetical protein
MLLTQSAAALVVLLQLWLLAALNLVQCGPPLRVVVLDWVMLQVWAALPVELCC